MLKNRPFGPKSSPRNITSRGGFLEPKLGLPRVPQPGQRLRKEKIFSAKALSGFLEGIVACPFGSTNGWTKVLFEA